jgi:hypothetical protein
MNKSICTPPIDIGNHLTLSLWLREKNERSYGCSPLPPEMLEVISQKLQSFDDLFNFSGVCTMWRSVQKTYCRKFLESHSPLIVHTTTYAKRFCSFYSLLEKRAYNTKMSTFWGLTYYVFSSGYLIMTSANKTKTILKTTG